MPSFSLAITFSLIRFCLQLCNVGAQNGSFPAVFAFGDSILDTGNNNNLNTLSKCNFLPYGQDLQGGTPTGRFSDGKVPSDLVAEALGVKELLPSYLSPSLRPEDLQTGVCFASGGSGYDSLTASVQGVVSVSDQLNLFKEYISKLKVAVGEEKTNLVLSNSLYLVSAGNNDIAISYFTDRLRMSLGLAAYSDLLVKAASDFTKDLYALGARKIAILGALPLGCLPSARTLSGICLDYVNQAAQLFNSKLSSTLDSLTGELTNATVAYVDVYSPLLDLIQDPAKSGFEVVNTGCCPVGLAQGNILCTPGLFGCTDASKYVFWDAVHPTERAYGILVTEITRKFTNLTSSDIS